MGGPRPFLAALWGTPIGVLGGLIGLGGAEFRLPVLKATFGYPPHRAVALNLAVSLVTLAASLFFRARVGAAAELSTLAPVILGVVAGAMTGAYLGAAYAASLSVERLERLILLLLVTIGCLLVVEGFVPWKSTGLPFGFFVRIPAAMILGLGIGLVSSMLGVAGGELIIPTLVFVFGVDIKVAGTASILISLPTVVVGLLRHHEKGAFRDGAELSALVLPMGAGSIVGAAIGGALVPYVPSGGLKVGLGVILVTSAVRIFRHRVQ